MSNWIRLVRWPNLLIVVFIFLTFRFGFLVPFQVATSLNLLQYILLMLSVILIMAGGNVINDIYDKTADRINKPGKNPIGTLITEKNARIVYWVLSILGLGLGYFMGYSIGAPMFGSVHLIAFFLLWMYSTDFKHRAFLGNFIVSILAAMVILTVFLFDVVPANREAIGNGEYDNLLYIFLIYTVFSFLTTLIRELVKDVEDIHGDRRVGSRTLAILIPIQRYKSVLVFNQLVTIALLSYVAYGLKDVLPLAGYIVGLVIFPLLATVYFVLKARQKEDWNLVSNLLKIIMVLGISFLYLLSFGG